jgi:hypothetical protein
VDRRAGGERRAATRGGGRDRRDETGWAPVPLEKGAAVTDDALLAAASSLQ